MALDASRGVVIVSGSSDNKLHLYSLADGKHSGSFGGPGADKGQFNWHYGGLCMTRRGTVLVAERGNKRLQEVNIGSDLPLFHVRFIQPGALECDFVDCNKTAVAASSPEAHTVTVLSWWDGRVLAKFGGYGAASGQLHTPLGLRLLADGSGVVVADSGNGRVVVYSLAGAVVRTVGVSGPHDVVEAGSGSSLIVCNSDAGTVSKVSVGSGEVLSFGSKGGAPGQFNVPVALGVVMGAGDSAMTLVVLEEANCRLQVFRA